MDQYYRAALRQIPGLGPARIQKLCDYFGSAQQAWMAPKGDLFLCKIISNSVVQELLKRRDQGYDEKLIQYCADHEIKVMAINDPDYPEQLKTIYDPPDLLFCSGQIPKATLNLAIVGARNASVYGKNAAAKLANELTKAGILVVSGAARGIDTAAHLGALEQGQTIAVLGCGIDQVYPPENKVLFEKIRQSGALISEYPPGTLPHAAYFPARNRIIAGLSSGVLVVEAAEKSGSLITAEVALNEGRDVFAIPGSIFSKLSRGTHYLIQQGAKLVKDVEDILEEYEIITARNETKSILTEAEQKICDLLSYEKPTSVEELIGKLQLRPADVTYILLQLELNGWIVPHQQGYVRSVKEVN